MKFLFKFNQTAVILTVLVFVAGCMSAPGGVDSNPAEGSTRDAAPSFTLKDPQGKAVSLEAALKNNKAVLLNFWATWCPPCREEIPDLIRLQKEYGTRSFTVLGVDVGESPAKVSNFINKMAINYPVARYRDQVVAAQYGIVGIPTSYLISSEGKIIAKYHAATPELFSDVKKIIES